MQSRVPPEGQAIGERRECCRGRSGNEAVRVTNLVCRSNEGVGPSEKSYEDLERDAIDARDAARKAELETGQLRAQIVELENEVRRWQRDFVWFRDRVVRKIPAIGRLFSRLSRQ